MKKNAGFTLIELLVVVLIIGVLAAVALPQYQKAVEKARLMQAVSRVNAIDKAHRLYIMENGTYANDIRDLAIEGGGDIVSYKQGNWTQGANNISAYYKGGMNCGPNSQSGAACSGNHYYIYTLANPSEIYCRGYTPTAQATCRSMAGGQSPALEASGNQPETYLMKF